MSKAIPSEEIVKFAFPALRIEERDAHGSIPAPRPIMNVPVPAVELLWKATVALVKTASSRARVTEKVDPGVVK
jgi:hypothetical protein